MSAPEGAPEEASQDRPEDLPAPKPCSVQVEILNTRGLHARAASKFVKLAAAFDAEIKVSKDGETVSGRSIMGLMMLGAGLGSHIRLTAEGAEAAVALAALVDLISRRFDEKI